MPENVLQTLDSYELAVYAGEAARTAYLETEIGAICAALLRVIRCIDGRSGLLRAVEAMRGIVWSASQQMIRKAVLGIAEHDDDDTFLEPLFDIAIKRVSDSELAASAADCLATLLGSSLLDDEAVLSLTAIEKGKALTKPLMVSLISEIVFVSSSRAISSLGVLLRRDYSRYTFCVLDGVSTLASCLRTDQEEPHTAIGKAVALAAADSRAEAEGDAVSATYGTAFSLWMLSYAGSPNCIEQVLEKALEARLPAVLASLILHKSGQRLKVARIVLASLRNLASGDMEVHARFRREMIGAGFLSILPRLQGPGKGISKDEDADSDATFLRTLLVQEKAHMSNLDIYLEELRGKNLRWSWIHNDQSFWIENSDRLVEEARDCLDALVRVVCDKDDTSDEARSVACSDLANILRFSVAGKAHILKIDGAKEALMGLMASSKSNEVREQALACVQLLLTRR